MSSLGLLAVISGFQSVGTPVDITSHEVTTPAPLTVSAEEEKPLTVKEIVEDYFADTPVLIDIARCESRFRQTDKNGNVLRGELTPADVGVMQINEKYHLKTANKLGIDIHTLEGNMDYARYLYEKEGARPWIASSACWAEYSDIAKK